MTKMPHLIKQLCVLALFCALTFSGTTDAFSTTTAVVATTSTVTRRTTRLYYSPGMDDSNSGGGSGSANNEEGSNNRDMLPDEDLIGDLSSSSSVDWDAEWKKVVQDQQTGQKVQRPGEGYYKTEAEIKAIKAANKVREQAIQAQASLPSWQMLKGDWKFWVGLLAIISVGTSLLSASTMSVPAADAGGSYYI